MSIIVQDGHETLRQTAQPVPVDEITSPQFQNLIADMHQTLATQKDGVALAAPQIAQPWRIFVVAPEVYKKSDKAPTVFINPEIIETSSKKAWMDEGCLSVRWLYGRTHRFKNATVRAYDEHGQVFERGGGGLLAQIFQHEIDHLDGILFHDHATDLEKLSDEEIRRMENKNS